MSVATEFDAVQLVEPVVPVSNRWRRKLAGWCGRWSRWEFWPAFLIYPPVALYIAYLGIRFRSLTLFTAANPAIPASGFVGESKHQILEQLKDAAELLPHSMLIESRLPAQRIAEAEEFIRRHGLQFPIVLKPDAGQRGAGVSIIRSTEKMQTYLGQGSFPVILQEYISGQEYGVFYYRYPGEDRGRVFSVTEKRMPVLVGDGKRTLEELILEDERAVCLSEFYLRMHWGVSGSTVGRRESATGRDWDSLPRRHISRWIGHDHNRTGRSN